MNISIKKKKKRTRGCVKNRQWSLRRPNHFTIFTKSQRYSRVGGDSCTPLTRSVCIDEPESLVFLSRHSEWEILQNGSEALFYISFPSLPPPPHPAPSRTRFPLYPTFRLSAERNARAFGRCGNGARASVSTFRRRR